MRAHPRQDEGEGRRASTRSSRAAATSPKLAKKNSEDPGSKDRAASSPSRRARPSPPFDKAAFSLEDGRALRAGEDPVRLAHHRGALRDVKPAKTTPLRRGQGLDPAAAPRSEKQNEAMTQVGRRTSKEEFDDQVAYQVGYAPPSRRDDAPATTTADRHASDDVADGRSPRRSLELQRADRAAAARLPVGPRADGATIVPHTVEEAYEVADAALCRRRRRSCSTSSATCSSRSTSWRCCSRSGSGRPRAGGARRSTRSSCAAIRTSSATPRRAARAGDVQAALGGAQDRAGGARGHLPRRARDAAGARCTRARCSGARRRSASTSRTSAGALAELRGRARRARAPSSRGASPSRRPRPSPTQRVATSSATCSSRPSTSRGG